MTMMVTTMVMIMMNNDLSSIQLLSPVRQQHVLEAENKTVASTLFKNAKFNIVLKCKFLIACTVSSSCALLVFFPVRLHVVSDQLHD